MPMQLWNERVSVCVTPTGSILDLTPGGCKMRSGHPTPDDVVNIQEEERDRTMTVSGSQRGQTVPVLPPQFTASSWAVLCANRKAGEDSVLCPHGHPTVHSSTRREQLLPLPPKGRYVACIYTCTCTHIDEVRLCQGNTIFHHLKVRSRYHQYQWLSCVCDWPWPG